LPRFDGSITAVDALNASRLSDAPLTSSHLFPHAGAGGAFSQLITDFGRTHNLVLTQKLEEEASNANALATREEIVLAADKAFYDALIEQALLQVAIQTVNTRQIMETRVRALTQNKLKSTLDLAFADVLLSQSKLLQLDAQNNADAAMASLDAVLGLDHEMTYRLVDNSDGVAGPPIAFDPLIQKALAQRPDLQSVALQTKSAQRFARAQWDQTSAVDHGRRNRRDRSGSLGLLLH
jgi:outer membrane protein